MALRQGTTPVLAPGAAGVFIGPLSSEINNGAVRNLALSEAPGDEGFRASTLHSPTVNADLLIRGTSWLSYGLSLLVVDFETGVSGFLGGGIRVQF